MDRLRYAHWSLGWARTDGEAGRVLGVNIFRFGDHGKETEIWNHRDDLGLMEQLGPPSTPARPATRALAADDGSSDMPAHSRTRENPSSLDPTSGAEGSGQGKQPMLAR
jgi:hypothetical protein